LTGKMQRVPTLKWRHMSKRFDAIQTVPIRNYSDQQTSLVIDYPELTELGCARNFPPLQAKGKRSANCRCRQSIPIARVFRCACPV
jgi:hypothetical protein